MSAYVIVTAPLGATVAANGIDLRPGERLVCRAEHWRRIRSNSAAIDAACEAMRVIATSLPRESADAADLERADAAWRAVCRPWSLGSATMVDGVRIPDTGGAR